jgi:hypothetical protein
VSSGTWPSIQKKEGKTSEELAEGRAKILALIG